jgi:aminomethyltransferase
MGHKTPLYTTHQECGAKIVDFGGWDMPLHYGSQIEEHHIVRRDAGMFDVSHMCVIDVAGADAKGYLRYLLANDVARLKVAGKALYSGLLNSDGGVIDDLIVYWLGENATPAYRVVVNAGTREKDIDWMQKQTRSFNVTLNVRTDFAMVAVQGPNAIAKTKQVIPEHSATIDGLHVFQGAPCGDWFIARTGYTGEDGLEIMLPVEKVASFWHACVKVGIAPCGLGARDTLRLEAGMNLYGSEMSDTVSPLTANMAWTIAWEPVMRDFIGRAALEAELAKGVKQQLVGLVLEDRGVLRSHQKVVIEGVGEGEITSGTFSPTLNGSIALARVPVSDATHCQVDIRGKYFSARIVKPPFVRNGKSVLN